jgi:hypothetical protein
MTGSIPFIVGCVAQGLRSHVTSSSAFCWCEQLCLLISSRCVPLVHPGCHDALLAHLGVMYWHLHFNCPIFGISELSYQHADSIPTTHVWCECVGSSVLPTLSTHTAAHTHTHTLWHTHLFLVAGVGCKTVSISVSSRRRLGFGWRCFLPHKLPVHAPHA